MPKTDPGASAADDAATALAKARASFAAYKGHVTRSAKVFDRQVKLVLGAEPTPQSISALETAHNDFLTRYNKASAALDVFQDAVIAAGTDDGFFSVMSGAWLDPRLAHEGPLCLHSMVVMQTPRV
jgi:hypothetical protein